MNALEVVKHQQGQALPQVFFAIADLERMAQVVAKSNLFGAKTVEQAMALMLIAQSEGEHPATVCQDYDIIQGKPTRKTNSVLARFQAAGGRVEWLEFTDKAVVGRFTHPQGGSLEVEWTIEMAQRAQLTGKDNWKGYPRAMLRARCIAEGVRAVYPKAIGGLMIAEEAQDVMVIDGTTGEVVQQPKARSARNGGGEAAANTSASNDAGAQASETREPTPPVNPIAATPGGLTPGMVKTVKAKIAAAQAAVGLTEEKVCQKFGVERLEDIPAAKVNEVIAYTVNPD